MNYINKSLQSNIVANFFQFGPLIAHYKLKDNIIEELQKRGKKTDIDHKAKLAGHICDEKLFNEEDKKWFLNKTNEIFLNFIKELNSRYSIDKEPNSITLQNLWINFMKSGDYNPPHDHSGDISFVIYTDVPSDILIENKNFKGVGSGPGCINFIFGETSKLYKSNFCFVPVKGNMFVFPAILKHYVAPFKSKVTRTSVSGNLFFVD